MKDDIASLINDIKANPGDEPMTRDKYVVAREQLRKSLAPTTPPHGPDSRLSDERLVEIEALLITPRLTLERILIAVPSLLAEVRLLRRENQLLSLSRGMPSIVGGD